MAHTGKYLSMAILAFVAASAGWSTSAYILMGLWCFLVVLLTAVTTIECDKANPPGKKPKKIKVKLSKEEQDFRLRGGW